MIARRLRTKSIQVEFLYKLTQTHLNLPWLGTVQEQTGKQNSQLIFMPLESTKYHSNFSPHFSDAAAKLFSFGEPMSNRFLLSIDLRSDDHRQLQVIMIG